jgi:periplasmic protein TonB
VTPRTLAPRTVVVQVSLLPSPPPPRSPPLLRPRFSQAPAVLAIVPRFSMVPPPPDVIRASAKPPPPMEASPPPPKQISVPANYLSVLVAHLNAYKTYPYEARVHREEGTVNLRFSLDRAGHVLSFGVVSSSGSEALDSEVRAMIQRADPFPPAPPQFRGDTLDLVVPIVFSLH